MHQADAAPLVAAQVEDDAATLGADGAQRLLQLRAAVAAQRAEDVAGQALGVDPDQHVLALRQPSVGGQAAGHQDDVLDPVGLAAVADGGEVAVRRGQCGDRGTDHPGRGRAGASAGCGASVRRR